MEKKHYNRKKYLNTVLKCLNEIQEISLDEISNDIHGLDPETIYIEKEELVIIRQCLESLDLLTRKIISLKYGFEEKVYFNEEIAELLGIRNEYVNYLEKKGLKTLKKTLFKKGW